MVKRFQRRFGTLRWKLTWSYVWVSVLISMFLNIVLLIVLLGLAKTSSPQGLQALMQEYVSGLAPVLRDSQEPQVLQAMMRMKFTETDLQRMVSQSNAGLQTGSSIAWTKISDTVFAPTATDGLSDTTVVLLLDPQQRILAGTFPASYAVGSQWRDPAIGDDRRVLDAAFDNNDNQADLVTTINQRIVLAAPIRNEQGTLLGVVYIRTTPLPSAVNNALILLAILIVVSIVSTFLLNALIGLVFGWFTSRALVRRLNQINQASATIAAGNFDARVADDSNDELGQLARQFNAMAQQLAANVLALRQLAERNAALAEQTGQLAIIEERNRLARDLHDSVSQELFSVTMLAAAAHTLLPQQPEKARSHVEQLDQMAQRALHEIRGLIFALRPAALGDQGLAPALRQLKDEALRRQGLTIDLHVAGERRLPLEHEQALYRITQEALANVIKHSGVQQARVELAYDDTDTTLTISDQGHGFDPDAPRNSHSLGLISINERANAVGGTIVVRSQPDHGTSVVVAIPRNEKTKD